jgi:hypothetical protein
MWMPHCRSDQRSLHARRSNAFKLLVLLVILDNGPLILALGLLRMSHVSVQPTVIVWLPSSTAN